MTMPERSDRRLGEDNNATSAESCPSGERTFQSSTHDQLERIQGLRKSSDNERAFSKDDLKPTQAVGTQQ